MGSRSLDTVKIRNLQHLNVSKGKLLITVMVQDVLQV